MRHLMIFIGLLVSLSAFGDDGFISGSEARRLIAEKSAILVDVRTAEEFQTKHIASALLFPVQSLSQDYYHLGDLDRTIIVYCRSGRRATQAKDILIQAGYFDVFNLGAMDNWEK